MSIMEKLVSPSCESEFPKENRVQPRRFDEKTPMALSDHIDFGLAPAILGNLLCKRPVMATSLSGKTLGGA